MTSLPPRVVLVRRQTEYASLLAAHATRGQAEFFLQARGQLLAAVETRDRQQAVAMLGARHAVPPD